MGLGLHAGWAIEGAVGSVQKVDATYLSPHVNMAARLETASQQYKVPLLASQVKRRYLLGIFLFSILGLLQDQMLEPLSCIVSSSLLLMVRCTKIIVFFLILHLQDFVDLLSAVGQATMRRVDVVTVKGSEVPTGIYTYDALQDQGFVEDKQHCKQV